MKQNRERIGKENQKLVQKMQQKNELCQRKKEHNTGAIPKSIKSLTPSATRQLEMLAGRKIKDQLCDMHEKSFQIVVL